MDYEKTIRKAESRRIQKERVYKEPEPKFEVLNPEYDAKMDRLLNIDNTVNKLTNINDIRPTMLLDRMRIKVLADHFKKAESNKQMGEGLLSFAGFRSWCGKGTNIMRNINEDKDFANDYIIDQICKNHDINTLNAKTHMDIVKADAYMLAEISDNYFINNLFSTKQKIKAAETITDHIFSTATLINLLRLGTMAAPLGMTAYRGYKWYKAYKEDIFTTELYRPFLARNGLRLDDTEVRPHMIEDMYNILQRLEKAKSEFITKSAYELSITGLTSTLFKDTALAALAAGGIVMKMVYDNIVYPVSSNIYDTGRLTQPEQTTYDETSIKDLLLQFQDFQNERLEKAGYEPINIFDEYEFKDYVNITETPELSEYEPITPAKSYIPKETPPQPAVDVSEDIYDITDIPFGVETDTLNELNKYIENLE